MAATTPQTAKYPQELLHESRRDTRAAKAEAEEASRRLGEQEQAMAVRDARISALLADNKRLSQELATAQATSAWQVHRPLEFCAWQSTGWVGLGFVGLGWVVWSLLKRTPVDGSQHRPRRPHPRIPNLLETRPPPAAAAAR